MDYHIEMPTRLECMQEDEEAAKERWWEELTLEDHLKAVIDSCIIGDAIDQLAQNEFWVQCINHGDEQTDLFIASQALEKVLMQLAKEASKP